MNDQEFRDKVIGDLAEIHAEIKIANIERSEIKNKIERIQEFVNKAKGGWIVLAGASAVVSAATSYILSMGKFFKH